MTSYASERWQQDIIGVYEFIRVSTGSQDESTQISELDTYAASNRLNVAGRVVLHGYSASGGEQDPALREAIDGIKQGRWHAILVTDSSRLERRDDATRFIKMLLAIFDAGGIIISLDEDEQGFGQHESFDAWTDALDRAKYNAEKSKTVKKMTYRGVKKIIANKSWYGPLPAFWEATGVRYAKVASCTDPDAVRAIYTAISNGNSLSGLARKYDTYPQTIRSLIRTRANMTGVFDCSYTYQGQKYTWQHTSSTGPVVDSELWHKANRVMGERGAVMNNTGGRPITLAKSWISGLLDCPTCGGHLYVLREKTLRCGGKGKNRRSCGVSGIPLNSVIEQIEPIVSSDYVTVYRYQHVSGNQGELDELKAELDQVRNALGSTDDDTEFDRLAERRKTLRAMIDGFESVPDTHEMTATGETLADIWQSGDKRVILTAIMHHIQFSVNLAGHVSIQGMYPDEMLIELDDKTCIKVSSVGLQRRRLAQYAETTTTQTGK